jgi:hypothetical protein
MLLDRGRGFIALHEILKRLPQRLGQSNVAEVVEDERERGAGGWPLGREGVAKRGLTLLRLEEGGLRPEYAFDELHFHGVRTAVLRCEGHELGTVEDPKRCHRRVEREESLDEGGVEERQAAWMSKLASARPRTF